MSQLCVCWSVLSLWPWTDPDFMLNSHLWQTQMHRSCFWNVHDFTIRRDDKHKPVHRLKNKTRAFICIIIRCKKLASKYKGVLKARTCSRWDPRSLAMMSRGLTLADWPQASPSPHTHTNTNTLKYWPTHVKTFITHHINSWSWITLI